MPRHVRIAIVGPGAIGSTFALQLARAGHDVTVVARGKRLAFLREEGAIVSSTGERAVVRVEAALPTETPWDLALVCVLASQLAPVLPALAESRAQAVMFMFNTFESLEPLREAVGSARFAFGFPSIVADLQGGRVTANIVKHGMLTTVSDARWATLFTDAGIPSVVHTDMHSWLRTHAAFITPFLVVAGSAYARGRGIDWREARRAADALVEGVSLVRRLGHPITPASIDRLSRLPRSALAAVLWAATRVPSVRKTGAAGPGETRLLIDAMTEAAGEPLPALAAIRP